MVGVKVYNGEKHDRSKWWYVLFGTIFALIIVLSLFFQNWSGVIVMFFFLGGYLFYQVMHLQQISMEAHDEYLRIGNVTYSWSHFQGFVLEIHSKTGEIKNIVFLTNRQHMIYTFADSMQNMKAFVMILQEKLPLVDKYNQSMVDKFSRKIKL